MEKNCKTAKAQPSLGLDKLSVMLNFWFHPGEGADFLAIPTGRLCRRSFFTADIPCLSDCSHMLSPKESHPGSAKPPSHNIGYLCSVQ